MSGFLLDTNCISELVRPRPDPRVTAWIEAVAETSLYLSVLTLGEIRRGMSALPQGVKRTRLEAWLTVALPARFLGRITPIDAAIANRWGEIASESKRLGRGLSVIDGLLAATAMHHNLTIVTRNTSGFESVRVGIFNPWSYRAN